MKRILLKCSTIGLAVWAFTACKKSDDKPSYTVPTTYTFSGVDSIPAKTMLSMIAKMEIEINKGNTKGTVVNAAKLKAMFANTGSNFTDTVFGGVTLSLNTSGINLQNKTVAAAQTYINSILDSIGTNSLSSVDGINGVAGVASSKLLSGNGVFWRQLFTKTMMGVLIGHQITDVYLGDSLNASNSLTAKQHAWDQAFYLWGVPVNFPTNRVGVKYWGSYTSQIDSGVVIPKTLTGIEANLTLMNAFLTGRAALANNDITTAKAQAAIIIATFEKIEAAAALHELNEAKNNSPAANIAGNVSESFGFWMALKFNTKRAVISDTQVNTIIALYGTNFYNLTLSNFETIKSAISTIYNWDSIKARL